MCCVYVTGRAATFNNVVPQANIADITTETVDGTYDADTATVINDIRTKLDTLLSQLQALGLQASS